MVPEQTPHVSIIILNWNTWQDTIECLESVFKISYNNYTVFLIDNGSENESMSRLLNWAAGEEIFNIKTNFKSLVYPIVQKPIKFELIDIKFDNSENIKVNFQEKNKKLYMIRSHTNLGFAAANNITMQIAAKEFNSDYFFLLNNDTVVHPESLSLLIKEMKDGNSADVAQSIIYHYEKPLEIANAGGRILWWGQTKYLKKIQKGTVKNISFVNGCALLIKAEVIKKYGYLSDKFFFGEEDFEFSMRMKQKKVKMVAVADSIVYHKIGSSKDQYMRIKKQLFIHGLNRIVDLKDFYLPVIWRIWREFTLVYYFLLLTFRHNIHISDAVSLIQDLRFYSKTYNDVKKDKLDIIFSNSKVWKSN